MENPKYFVISRFRGMVTIEGIKEYEAHPVKNKYMFDTFKGFDKKSDAEKWLYNGYFDDCDYAIFEKMNNNWKRL